MVGRDRELARVMLLLDDALAGGGRLVLCTGEAGIGKTRLADLPRAFRTADLRLIHAAICCSRYSLWTCCGVRY